MADKQMSITFSMGNTMDMLGVVTKEIFPYMSQAVDVVGKQVAARWVEEVQGAKLWSGEKDAYAQSISWKMTGDFSGYVEASYKWAKEIEEGRPARDLKRMLGTSLKVRRTKQGTRFLVIPFRHNIKSMPPQLAAQAKALEASTVTGMGQRRSGEITALSPQFGMRPLGEKRQKRSPFLTNTSTRQAQMVAKAQYQWGGRIKPGFFGPNPKGKTDIAAGMVRMDTSSGKGKSSQYMTFRIMSEKSKGWIVPQQPGQFLAKKVIDKIQPEAEKFFQKAMALDVKGS
ncbi:hypothetical protein EU642_22035 [Salmonella enterica]|nr:hypothetical protein [Salmonella enterica]EAO0118534.1 hypothetical protein [Salmonella enterica]EAO3601638.1 hypothetical protein [Salmonella enterica]EAR6391532.1 hypothetical protein [Salmonella enterica]EAV1285296.1 hypothetical protein [Salmonella enterica]